MIFLYPILALILFLIYSLVPLGYSGFLSVFIEWLTGNWVETGYILLVIGAGVGILSFIDIYNSGHRYKTSTLLLALTLNTVVFILNIFFILQPFFT
ncbi:MAG: hypothetical protein GX133_04750 [Syntrophomonadaceae bacterium]|nr:hypothetical protein [Syntrophomonadaceae bacterium]